MALLHGTTTAQREQATIRYQRAIAEGQSPRAAWEATADTHGAEAATYAAGFGLEDIFDRGPSLPKKSPGSPLDGLGSSTSAQAPRPGGRIKLG